MENKSTTFFDRVVKECKVSQEQLAEVQALAKAQNILPVHALIRLKFAAPQVALNLYADSFDLQLADLDAMDIPQSIVDLIPGEIATKSKIIPIDRAGQNIIVAMLNPLDLELIDRVRFKTGYSPRPVLAGEESIENAIIRYYSNKKISMSESDKAEVAKGAAASPNSGEDRAVITEEKNSNDESGPIIKLVDSLLVECLRRRASDIHIEPYETFIRVRMRIDGVLHEIFRPPLGMKNALIARVKIMAKIDISEKRIPQDGGIRVTISGRPIDFRVNTCPTMYGEKVVMRILDKSSLQVDMTKLGLEQDDLDRFSGAISAPFGMVLVTGPTGSGKTTTLYSALSELNTKDSNLITAEDPVEFNIEGINQLQVNPQIDLSFATALRSFLRQDPDVIMVGEIRDSETAEIAVKAALTGHLVLSTLHTNSAADTITRLVSMGVEPFNLISSLNAVIAQRLVRRLCLKCRAIDPSINADHLVKIGIPAAVASKIQVYKAVGCSLCGNTGYKGRVAVFEVMAINDPIKEAIMAGKSAMELKKIARMAGMRTLRQNALRKLAIGETDVYEVVQVTASDDSGATPHNVNAA